MVITSISWRNVWRNKLRSSVILTAVGLGMFAGVFAWAFYAGMVNQRIETAISTESSNIQIHKKGYLEDPTIKGYMPGADSIIEIINENNYVKGSSKRILINAMLMSAEQGSGALVMGIDPESEIKVTDLHEKLVEGAYFEGIKRNPILVGEKLADKLKLKARSKVVLTLQHMDGTMTKAQFRVAGIYKLTNTMYEEMNVFARNTDLVKLTGMDKDASHEIAIKVKNNQDEQLVYRELEKKFEGHDVKLWRDLMPEVSLVEESMDLSMIVFIIIILVGLCLAIINTMLMAVLERVKEIGMLMAIGMNKARVFNMILMETVFLTLTGTIVGIIVASGVSLYFGKAGFDLSMGAEAYESMGYSAIVYPLLKGKIILEVTLMVFVASLLSAIYPAIKALKLNPADAIRSDV